MSGQLHALGKELPVLNGWEAGWPLELVWTWW